MFARGTRELPLELGNFLRAEPDGNRHLSRYAVVGTGADPEDGSARLDHCADRRLDRRCHAYATIQGRLLVRFLLGRILSQHAAAGAALPVVLRAAGIAAEIGRHLAEATAQRAVLDR